MATMGSSELLCVVCNSNVDMASCVNIYYTSLPPNGDTLASFVLRVLRPNNSDFGSSYICLQCYHLFRMLEQAQSNVTNIRSEILKAYQSGEKRKLIKETVDGSTETILNEKNFISNFAHEEKLEIASTLCHIQDTQDNYLKFKKFGEINKSPLDDDLQNFVDNSSTSIPQEIFTGAIKDERVPKDKATENLSRQDKTSTFTEYAQCQLCNRLFKSTKNLDLHLLKHGGSRPYQCQKCEERFAELNLANVHCVEMHPKEKNCIGLASKPCENEVVDFSDIDGILSENLFKETDNGNEFNRKELNWNDSVDNKSNSTEDESKNFTILYVLEVLNIQRN